MFDLSVVINALAQPFTQAGTYVDGAILSAIVVLASKFIVPKAKKAITDNINNVFIEAKKNEQSFIDSQDEELQQIIKLVIAYAEKKGLPAIEKEVTAISNSAEEFAAKQIPVVGQQVADVINTAETTINSNLENLNK